MAENDAQGEWMLPDGWAYFTLSELAADTPNAIRRGPFGSAIKKAYFVPSGYKVYEQKNAIYDDFTLGHYYIDEDKFEELRSFEAKSGDIIMSCSGTVGKLAVVPPDAEPGVINQALLKITLNENVVSTKYFVSLLGFKVWEIILHNTRGSAMVNIASVKTLKAMHFPIPPLPEQRRIVAEIETQFTRLDAAVAALERAQANIRRYKASVLKAACEGRLVPTEAELAGVGVHRDAPLPYESADQLLARILAERRTRWEAEHPGKRYQEPTPPDTGNLPELPEGWVWASLEILASYRRHAISSGPFGSSLGTKDYRESGVPVIRGQNVADGQLILDSWVYVSEEKAAQLERSVARPGDLVVVAVGSSGRPAIVPPSLPKAILSQNCNKITPDTNLILPKYLVFAMQIGIIQEQLDQKTTDTVRKFLSLTNLRKTLIPLPPLTEQRRIVAEVERRLSLVAALEASVEAALARAGRLRQAVLKQAFEGRLVPQDPDDEPASVLLEQIRAERAQQGRRSDRKPQPQQMELF